MPKLIRYCDGVMEAAWLAAVLCIPLFFSVWGEAPQAEKSYLLRSLAILLLAAWAIKFVARIGSRDDAARIGRDGLRSLLRTPLAVPTCLLALALTVATVLSLSPWESFWGLGSRRDGTYTQLSGLVFFAAIAASLRSEQQVQRIITVAILTSVPIGLYGIGQRFSIEPVIFQGGESFRVTSTLGNAVFLAAYLIMVLPLTLSRIVLSFWGDRAAKDQPTRHVAQGVVYVVIAFIQACAIAFTVSRGPIIGLAIGYIVRFLVSVIHWRKRWLRFAAIETGVILLAVAVLLSRRSLLPQEMMISATMHYFAEMARPDKGSGKARIAIWNLAVQSARFSKVMETVDGQKDPLAGVRFLIGYGPETARHLVRLHRSREYNTGMDEAVFLDRFHNDFWDTLIATGVLGLAAYLTMTLLAGYFGCAWLGLLPTPRHRAVFWWLTLAGGVVGTLGLVSWRGMAFLGVGLRFGTVMGWVAFLIWFTVRKRIEADRQGATTGQTLLMIALFTGLIAHQLELAFSFGTETTLLYSSIYLALMLAAARLPRVLGSTEIQSVVPAAAANSDEPNRPTAPGRNVRAAKERIQNVRQSTLPGSPAKDRCSWSGEAMGGLLLVLVLANLGAMLVLTHLTGSGSASKTMIDAFARLPGQSIAIAWSIPISIGFIWLLFALTWTNESPQAGAAKNRLRSLAVVLAVSGVLGLIFWYVLAKYAVLKLVTVRLSLDTLDQYLRSYTRVVDLYYGATFLVVLVMAAFLPGVTPRLVAGAGRNRLRTAAALALAAGAGALIYSTNMKWSKAGVIMSRAEPFKGKKQWPMVAAVGELAMRTVPSLESPPLALSEALVEEAATSTNADEQRRLFLKADRVLETGSASRPLDLAFLVRRGDLRLRQAELQPDSGKKEELGREAMGFYRKAAALDPVNDELWYRLGYMAMAVLKSPDEALPFLLRSLDCYVKSHTTYGLLGNVFYYKGTLAKDAGERTALFRRASTNYQQASDLAGESSTNSAGLKLRYSYDVALGKIAISLRDLSQAVAAYQNALRVCPPAERWQVEETLARLYADRKEKSNSVEHLQRALELAPPERQAALIKLKAAILASP